MTTIAWNNGGPVMNADGTIGEAPSCCCGGGSCCVPDCSLEPCKPTYLTITAIGAPVLPNYGYGSSNDLIDWDNSCEKIFYIWDDSEYEGESASFDMRVRRHCPRVNLCGTCARDCTFTIEYSKDGVNWFSTLAETSHPHPEVLSSASIQYGDDFMGDTGGIKAVTCSPLSSGDCLASGGEVVSSCTECDCDCPSEDIFDELGFSISHNVPGITPGTIDETGFSRVGGVLTETIFGDDGTLVLNFSCENGVLGISAFWNGLIEGCPCTAAEAAISIPCSATDRTWMAGTRTLTLSYGSDPSCAVCDTPTVTWTISYPC